MVESEEISGFVIGAFLKRSPINKITSSNRNLVIGRMFQYLNVNGMKHTPKKEKKSKI